MILDGAPQTVALIDGNHLMHRILNTPTGQLRYGPIVTGGIYGFLRTLRLTLDRFQATKCVVVWDGSHSARRKKLYPKYKAGRVYKEGDEYMTTFRDQHMRTDHMLGMMGVRSIRLPNREGDDIVAHASFLCTQQGIPSVVVSEDQDFSQLVSDTVSHFRPIKNVVLTPANFQEVTGLPARLWLTYRSLVGDGSDGIDGVPNVGEKTAKALLQELAGKINFEDQDEVWDAMHAHCFGHRLKKMQSVAAHMNEVKINYEVMDLSAEDLLPDEFEQVRKCVNDPLPSGFQEGDTLAMLGKYACMSLVSTFVEWSYPFRRLS